MITPYGVVYRNSNEIVQTYDGMNFLYYQYEDTPVTLLLSAQNRCEYLYLPIEQSELNKTLERLDEKNLESVSWQVEEHNIPDNLSDMVVKDQSDLYALNQFASIFKEMGQHEVTALSELAPFAKITNVEELKTLASFMYEFECFPDIHTPEQYGRYMICESDRFEYDENLKDYIDLKAYGQDKIGREPGHLLRKVICFTTDITWKCRVFLIKISGLKLKNCTNRRSLNCTCLLRLSPIRMKMTMGIFIR